MTSVKQTGPLPKSVYLKHGAYYFVKENVWHRLGKAWDKEAKEKWASLSSPTPHASSVAFLLDSYLTHLVGRVKAGQLAQRLGVVEFVDVDTLDSSPKSLDSPAAGAT